MANLIEELRSEHARILDAFQEIRRLGIGSAEARAVLLAVRAGLLAHLAKEDARLYPPLRKASASDRALCRKVDFFARDVEEITRSASAFFDTLDRAPQGTEFAREFGALAAALRSRIQREESVLYPEYESRNSRGEDGRDGK